MQKRILVLVLLLVMAVVSVAQAAILGERVLKRGMIGDDVKALQTLLAEKGFYSAEVDGVYGSMTYRAVLAFQRMNNVEADGSVGVSTLQALRSAGSINAPSRYGRALTVTATAYSSQDPGVGSYTARGNLVTRGVIAVDPRVIPLGTRVYVEGYGYAVADDTGGAITGNRIDVAFSTRSEALQFGVQQVQVFIVD